MKVKTEDFYSGCGCRSVGECTHDDWVEKKALDALVDEFAQAMKQRLLQKHLKGWHGWDDEENYTFEQMDDQIKKNLDSAARRPTQQHVSETEEDLIDIANLAAFWWNRLGEKIVSEES